MQNPMRQKILMVGDSLESDIQGGLNAGIDTCWFNPHKREKSETITPHFEILSLKELENLV